MTYINVDSVKQQDGQAYTKYQGTASQTSQTFVYRATQDNVSITNLGLNDITVVVNGASTVINQNRSALFASVSQFSITVAQGKQDFVAESWVVNGYSDLYTSSNTTQLTVNDLTTYNATLSIDTSVSAYFAAFNPSGTYASPVFVPASTYQFEFEFVLAAWLILGGDQNTWVGFGLGSEPGKLVEFTSSAVTTRYAAGALYTLTSPNAQDVIRVIVPDSNTFRIMIKRVGTTNFVDYCTVKKSDAPLVTAWTNSRLGYTRFSGETGTASNTIFKKGARMGASNTLSAKITDQDSRLQVSQRWNGAEASFLGDSITAYNKWQGVVQTLLGLSKSNNYGLSGSSLASVDVSDVNSMAIRSNNIPTTSNLVVVWGGTNDWGNPPPKPLGTISDTVNTTVYGAVYTIINKILTNIPGCRLAFITPMQRNRNGTEGWRINNTATTPYSLEQTADAIIAMCKIYGIPVLDLHRTSGITTYTFNKWTFDGLHPNDVGMDYVGRQISSFLNSL